MVLGPQRAQYDNWKMVAPQGYGPGTFAQNSTGSVVFSNFWPFDVIDASKCTGISTGTPAGSTKGKPNQTNYCQFSDINGVALGNTSWFGNYILEPGTTMFARPFGGAYSGAKQGTSGYDVGYGLSMNKSNTGGGQFQYA